MSPSIVRLRDVARVEMGAASYTNASTFDLHPTVGLAIHQLPEANALDSAERVRQKMEELKSRFPDGVDYNIAYDTTPFIRESVEDVVKTLLEAVVLVGVVVLIFLQNWRSTIIPLVAVPVAIIGTFAVMAALSAVGARYNLASLNFSLNNISLFGLVLAIGIVVDDAIVVVENVERWLEQGLEPRAAAHKAMDEVTGPIIAVALVLCAVFVPCAFIGGVTGQFFRQFAVTIAASTLFSAFNSLTLSPALAAILLKPHAQRRDPLTWLFNLLLGWFFWLFNVLFGAGVKAYSWTISWLLRGSVVVLGVYVGLLLLTGWVFKTAPTGFVPDQDQGRLIVNIQLPDSASLQRTINTTALVEKIAHETPGVAHTVTVSGMSLVASVNSSNFATLFIILDPFDKRKSQELKADAIMARLRRECAKRIKDGQVTVFGAPPIPGLSVASGYKIMVEDRSGVGLDPLQQQTDAVVGKLQQDPTVVGSLTQFRSNTPQLYMDVDRIKVQSLGVSLSDVDQTMQIFLGSLYVNSFNEFGRYWQVNLQAEGQYRARVEDVNLLAVRNQQGQMVPLGTLVNMRPINGSVSVTRYNLYTAAPITGNIRPGVSSGDAIADIDRVAEQTLPRTMNTEWTELMFLQIKAGETAFYVFLLAVLLAFLVLAALYESWSLPLAVILVVPLCLLCSVGGVLLSHNAVDIFVQIGLVVLVGLACKNAILIVEFAHHLRGEGKELFEATVEASKLRVRPILMTSLAFILGVVPLVIASGAGAEMRRSLGTAVFSGMLGVTLFGVFLTPVFFYVIQWFSETRLLSSAATVWIGSAAAGAALGLAFVYLFMQIGLKMPLWTLPTGACAGALLGLLIPTLQQHSGQRSGGGCRPSANQISGSRRPNAFAVETIEVYNRSRAATGVRKSYSGQSAFPGGDPMISHFFIDRPIFATVLSILFVLAGLVAVFALPVAQYPEVTPPTVLVVAIYPGANAETVRDTVAAPIESQVSGVEGMMYMSSQCTNDGTYSLTVTFQIGTNSDMAQVLVQNRVSLALPVIPDLVQREGINVKKQSPNTLMIVNLVSNNDEYPDLFLSNYATIEIRDELGRLPGVAGVGYLGERDYSMRAWLDPNKMAALGLTTTDVVNAISAQNLQVAAGSIGQQPVPKGQQFQLTINTLGRLVDPDQFANIILKVGTGGPAATQNSLLASQGTAGSPATSSAPSASASSQTSDTSTGTAPSVVYLRDVAQVELGSQQYDQSCTLDGKPSVALTIYQLPGSNALQTANGVEAKMQELKKRFPEGVDYEIVYDTTPFIRQSVKEVFLTFRDAVLLVAFVVLVFLQNWRAAIIPLIAVPVAIIGTFAVMALVGFSLNNISLFGLVLAIGIVVDDAIVVVENVERWLEQGLEPREAARKAMDEVTGPVVAIALVLSAVFVPCAFIGGITGQFFRQFAVTIAVSTLISAFNSLTLSPALAALLLKRREEMHDPLTWLLNLLFGWFFRLFNWTFGAATNLYTRTVGGLLRVSVVVLLVYAGLLGLTYLEFTRVPTGFVPQQDKGYLLVNVQLPDAASVERTQRTMSDIEGIVLHTEGVQHTVAVAGQSLILNANAPNLGSMYVLLKPFEERGRKHSADAIANAIREGCRQNKKVRDAVVSVFGAPPIEGLGTTGGFKFIIEDRGNVGLAELQKVSDQIVADGNSNPELRDLYNSARFNTPWLYLDIDRTKCLVVGIQLSDVFNTLQDYLGSYYVNNFNEFGRTWQVNIQADRRYRNRVRDIPQLQVRNNQGQMVQLGTLLTVRSSSGPLMIMRYNMYSATAITGDTAPGVSSSQAVGIMQNLASKDLPPTMSTDWTELTYLQLQAGNTALYVFGLAVVFVFLVLAAQYESWKLPLAVILVVPMCLLCSIVGVDLAGMDVTIFTQIGFIVLVGLASKNAILIVEFAKQQRESGVPPEKATLEAARLRLRPILMTSFAFIFGVIPLVLASGAGAEMRQTLGLAVFTGMLGVTLFGIFLTPVFFYVLQWFGKQKETGSLHVDGPDPSRALVLVAQPTWRDRRPLGTGNITGPSGP